MRQWGCTDSTVCFFRYHATAKVLVLPWVNGDEIRRVYESSDDAYRIFRKMLGNGRPPDDWTQLLKEAGACADRLQSLLASVKETH